MTRKNSIDRRRFLARALAMSGAAFLTGCDKLSESEWFPRVLGSAEILNRKVQHLITPRRAMAEEFTETDLSPHFKSNGTHVPSDLEYQALAMKGFRDWRLKVSGLVKRPTSFSLKDLRALPSRTQITRHDCVEGWSCIGKWKGVRLSVLLEHAHPLSTARYVVFHCFDSLDLSGDKYYESIDFDDAYHPQTILAYEMNDKVLPIPYGAPLRLRVERQLGYKMAKYLKGIELVQSFEHIAGGKGGYWEDRGYEWYAGI
ncbi:MAG TPA: molybdopterin-binding protein [Gammaproteobacteria bacterium]|nr:molybdopterin-binding protein [Gammaproteobacteria bacterium]